VGRKSNIVATLVGLLMLLPDGVSQAQPHSGGGHGAAGRAAGGRNAGSVQNRPAFKSMQDRWRSLSPEERQIFRRNAERWMRMTPEERKLMRQREKIHRQELKSEADAILRQSGLHLDSEKQARFEQRYIQERRKIERALNQEVEAKRKQELPVLNERLKKEFQKSSAATAHSATPAHSASPAKGR
jgi:hypothetical protein